VTEISSGATFADKGDGVGGDGENGVNFDLFPMEDL